MARPYREIRDLRAGSAPNGGHSPSAQEEDSVNQQHFDTTIGKRARAAALVRRSSSTLLAMLIGLGLALPTLPPQSASAAETFVVNTTEDQDDACDELGAGDCSLREAIVAANANPGKDTIAFDIPGGGVKAIKPQSSLPAITDPVVIDGYTQAGAQANTAAVGTNAVLRIELDGSEAGLTSGLLVQGGDTTIRGLVINRFGNGFGYYAIELTGEPGNTGNVIEANFLGTDPSGTNAAGNFYGLYLQEGSNGNRVGGSSPAARNLISGNTHDGIELESNDNTIQGNLIGTDRTGTQPLGNGERGIDAVSDANDNRILANTIAFNGDAGVAIGGQFSFGTGNQVSRNSIFANGGLGIDLSDDGPTANDPGDADEGGNNLQNFPVLTAAKTPAKKKKTTIKGALNSRSNRQYLIEVFANAKNGDIEGQTFVGQKRVTTNANGDASFVITVDRKLSGQALTATTTDDDAGDTSELSAPVTVKKAKKAKGKKKGKGKNRKKG
jgi:CSLREA domain-containing protein